MGDRLRQGAGGTPRAGFWWTAVTVAALAAVAWTGWLMARPQHGGTPPSAADRPALTTSSGHPSAAGPGTAPAAPTGTASSHAPGRAPSTHAPAGAASLSRPTGHAAPAGPERPTPTARTTDSGEGPQAGEHPRRHPVRLPGVPPAPAQGRWLVARPLPADAQARGRVVAGFPSSVLPTPRWAHVRRSSVAGHGSLLQATLHGRTGRRAATLLEHYRSALIARGFGVAPSRALGHRQAIVFFRHGDSVVVTVDPKRSTYLLYAVLHAARRR